MYLSYRWDKLQSKLDSKKFALKRATGTRWSSKFDAVYALNTHLETVVNVLFSLIVDNCLQSCENINTAVGLLKKLCNFEFIIFLKIWYTILKLFHETQVHLQKVDLSISTAMLLFQSFLGVSGIFLQKRN